METAVAIEREAHLPQIDRRSLAWLFTFTTLACLVASLAVEKAFGPAAIRLVLALNVLSYIAGGWFSVAAAVGALREGRLGINFLMIAAALGAAVIDQWHEGATLLFLFSLSGALESLAMERSRNAVSKLLRLRPKEAMRLKDGREERVPLEALRPGDIVVVRPGEMIPVDGQVRGGRSDVNQSSITGESRPVDKAPADKVFAGTLNGSGMLEVEMTRAVEDSTLARIIHLVEEAQAQKSRTQRIFERFEGPYVGLVAISAAFAIVVPWLLLHEPFKESFYRAMVLLVVASPCALIISTPAAMLSAIANGAFQGILFKGGAHLERLAGVRTVVFDKTGTITTGKLALTDVVSYARGAESLNENELLATAAVLESRSEHPIAQAIMTAARERGLALPAMTDFESLPGRGVYACADGYLIWIGGERLFREHGEVIPADLLAKKQALENEGKTVLVLHRELRREKGVGTHETVGGWLGLIAVADTPRPEARSVVERLRAIGVKRVVMLTGDNPGVGAAVAEAVRMDEFHADLLPEDKVAIIHHLREQHGPIMMVGDGVNDAPALAAADVGAAMGAAGSDVALEAADVVLMADDLTNVPYALSLGRRASRVVRQNVAFALAVIVVLVVSVFRAELTMPLGVVGHEGSTLLVVANGLRLLVYQGNKKAGV